MTDEAVVLFAKGVIAQANIAGMTANNQAFADGTAFSVYQQGDFFSEAQAIQAALDEYENARDKSSVVSEGPKVLRLDLEAMRDHLTRLAGQFPGTE